MAVNLHIETVPLPWVEILSGAVAVALAFIFSRKRKMDPADAADLVASFVSADIGDGTPVVFSRIVDPTTRPPTRVYAPCDASVRNYTARELGNGILQGDTNLIIEGDSLSALRSVLGTPPREGDEVKYAGFRRNVVSSSPILMGDLVVLINVLVRG